MMMQLDGIPTVGNSEETPAERRSRLQGYYDRAVPLAEESEH